MSPLPIAYDCWHIHDCSIDPGFRGKGLGTSLIKQVFTVAQKSNHQRVQLVSVQNSQMYWHRYGFLKCETEPKYDTTYNYGADAVLMSMSF
jgi:predicted GNAT family N-acyltransferase